MNALQKFSDLPVGRVLMASLIFCGLYYLMWFDDGRNFRATIAANQQAKVELNKEMVKVNQELDEINQLKAAQQKDVEKLNRLLEYIPEKLTKTELMRTLGNQAKSVGVSINQIRDNSSQTEKSEFYEEVGVDVDLTGNFGQLMLFMANLTSLNQILSIDKLDLRAAGSEVELLTMAAAVRGYRYLPTPAVGN